jgi:hypothetical protein
VEADLYLVVQQEPVTYTADVTLLENNAVSPLITLFSNFDSAQFNINDLTDALEAADIVSQSPANRMFNMTVSLFRVNADMEADDPLTTVTATHLDFIGLED